MNQKLQFKSRRMVAIVEHRVKGLSLAEIGRKYGISRQRVHQVLRKARWLGFAV